MNMRLQPFTVGPILGAVSSNTARVWGRGDELRVRGELQRFFGAARIRKCGGVFSEPQYFKLNPNFDLTGVTVFQDLQGDTIYEYEIGAITLNAEFGELGALHLDWGDAHRASFRTASCDKAAKRSFVFGSCRYLLRLFGGAYFDDRGDKTFRTINKQLDEGRNINQVLMLGDQIYADDLNILFPDTSVDDYFRRYRDVFSQTYFANLVSRVPTYMTLDDHEIEDNWPDCKSGSDVIRKFPAAMHAYFAYQLSHSPLFDYDENGRLTRKPSHCWYYFNDGCCGFFVMDTRTERFYDDNGERIRIISDVQMQALKCWLNDDSTRVKFVATSVPFFPDLKGGGRDRWDSFTEQRCEILDHIRTNKIRKVVFLSGDVHSSMSAELHHTSDADFNVISVVSSPFYWPYPHTKSGDFIMSGNLHDAPGYVLGSGSPVISTDCFARANVTPCSVQVEFYERKGRLLNRQIHTL